MTQSLYLSLIRAALPDLEIQSIEQTGGQFNHILLINDSWVFRFPRYREGIASLAAETALLHAVQGRLPIPVPEIEVTHLDPPVPGLAFCGYRKLHGQSLRRQDLAVLPDPIQESIASQLSDFMRSFHAYPPGDLPVPLPGNPPDGNVADLRPGWEKLYSEIRAKLFPVMRLDARKLVTRHFEAYLDDPVLQRFYPCLRHGDLGGTNILWDPVTKNCTGVIDFSGASLGDPAMDLASTSTLGEHFFQWLIRRYQPDPIRQQSLLARANFYRGTFALMEALDGLRCGDQAAYQSGMAEYI